LPGLHAQFDAFMLTERAEQQGEVFGALVPSPSAVKRTISAPQTCFCGELPSETIPESRSWSAGGTVTVIPVRMPQTRTA